MLLEHRRVCSWFGLGHDQSYRETGRPPFQVFSSSIFASLKANNTFILQVWFHQTALDLAIFSLLNHTSVLLYTSSPWPMSQIQSQTVPYALIWFPHMLPQSLSWLGGQKAHHIKAGSSEHTFVPLHTCIVSSLYCDTRPLSSNFHLTFSCFHH